MNLTRHDRARLRTALQEAVVKCSERCLYQSAKWAAELLDALPEGPDEDERMGDVSQPYVSPAISVNHDPVEAELEAREMGKYLLAKALFDCKEFERCAAVFLPDSVIAGVLSPRDDHDQAVVGTPKGKGKSKGAETPAGALPTLSQRSLFLALYAKFMAGEKQKEEESEMVMGPHDLGTTVNKQLLTIGRFLETWFTQRRSRAAGNTVLAEGSQGWLEYLYGMVLAREKNEEKAMQYFLQSVHLCPMNWGCWLEITSLISRVEDLGRILPQLPQNLVSYLWQVFANLELYQQSPQLANSINELLEMFPTSSFLLTCTAMLSYHSKDLYAAEQHFSRLLSLHPYRLDSLDHYSNILYILNARPKLAFLAHLCSSVDKFRPESCVVVGNYYSILSQHEKAVQYFRRALTLDRTCLSAWTLMGHEYVELKNTHAAIESYRRAVDVNRRDYRAWYGLGQTYEMLEMHTYALWYYKKAAGLRPWDGKMWMAVGSCLQKMERYKDGIKALKRALVADNYYDAGGGSDGVGGGGFANSQGSGTGRPVAEGGSALRHMDPEILLQIATMYDQLEDEEQARAYMEMCVAQEDGGVFGGGGGGGTRSSDQDESDDNDAEEGGDSATTIHGKSSRSVADADADDDGTAGAGAGGSGGGGGGVYEGIGVTAATSKARMWLARHAMRHGDFETANRLANELCQDGVEVEEAKALIREARSRMAGLTGG